MNNYISMLRGINVSDRTKFSTNFFERKLKVSATTRNWKTVQRLYEMANKN